MRLRNLLCLTAAIASLAGAVQAQTPTPLNIKDGQATPQQQQLCEYTVGGFLAACGTQSFQNLTLNTNLILAATAAYGVNTALCTSATVATCNGSAGTGLTGIYFVVPTGTIHVSGGSVRINDTLANSWGINSQIWVDLWANPGATLSAGDGGAYKIFTGTANYKGSLLCTTSLGVQGDGILFACNVIGSVLDVNLGAANAHLFATFYTPTGSGTPTANSVLSMSLNGTF